VLRLAVTVRGVVQGVGFRPLVHATATRHGLSGWVRNRCDGVALEVQGRDGAVHEFLAALRSDAPPPARVDDLDVVHIAALPPASLRGFAILPSAADGARRATLPADLVSCAACDDETAAPAARRHRYPFTSCARCGPRYTVVESLPYDRPRTTMADFPPCPQCAAEHDDPGDRRCHAQTVACPACGPALRLVLPDGSEHARADAALAAAIDAVTSGRILAMKGLGGFQLVADATDGAAVARLRARKHRPDKPFAVLLASLDEVRRACAPSVEEEHWLASPEGPIVLVARRDQHADDDDDDGDDGARAPGIAHEVAPGSARLGVLLPTTPLHRLLAAGAGRPLVCTSGNLSDEPICIDDAEARTRLAGVADLFLLHDRRVVRPVDDSVVRVGTGGLTLLRRARGFAPLPLAMPGVPPGIVALGAQLKSTVAVSLAGEVVLSQHLGDLHTAESAALLGRTVADLLRLFALRPRLVACDLHPDYASTHLAERLAATWDVPLVRVQHHHAHVAACLAEHAAAGPALGLAWDGAGLGDDGVLWGGEALAVDGADARRVAHLRPLALPGGERAVREPRRIALALLHALDPDLARDWSRAHFTAGDVRVLLALLERGRGTPTTSVGRLFDGVAALLGVRDVATFEGQAAMELEALAEQAGDLASFAPYPLPLVPRAMGVRTGFADRDATRIRPTCSSDAPAVADWAPLVRALLDDRARGVPATLVAARFHASLAHLAEAMALVAGLPRVALGGGCFQNALLAHAVRARLAARGFTVLAPRLYPPNDGAIALGQVLVAAARHPQREEAAHVPRDPR